MCVLKTFIIIYFLDVRNLWVKYPLDNYNKNSRWVIIDNIGVGFLWVITNNNKPLLSWIAYIIPIIKPFLISHFFYYSIFRYTQSYYMSLSHIFLQYIFVQRKSNRWLFLNFCEWNCVHHEDWCYSLILVGCLAKGAGRTEFYSRWHKSTFKDNTFAVWFFSIVRLF